MKKIITLLLLSGMTLVSTTLYAADASDGSLSFWEKLRRKVESMAPHKAVSATTAVGGVRGAQVTANDTYWKGEKTVQEIDQDELVAFQKAMGLVEAGEVKQAQAAFADFVRKNPDSPLRKDADQALAQLQSR
jgi:TolA-binding protein